MSDRELLRRLTLGAPPRQMRKKLVPIRDASRPRVLEVEVDEEGKPKSEPMLDEQRQPLFDEQGAPMMREVKRYRHPPALKDDGSAACVEVREPGLKQRAAIFRAAGVTGEGAAIDMAALQVETVVALTYEPGTNIKVFTDADKPALAAQLAGGFVDDIFEVAYPLMNAAKEEEVEKN
jgi:hypothetical protein